MAHEGERIFRASRMAISFFKLVLDSVFLSVYSVHIVYIQLMH